MNLLNFASEWLYSPIDQDLENKLYFMDFKTKEDKENEKQILNKVNVLVNKNKKFDTSKQMYKIEEFYQDKLDDIFEEDLNTLRKENGKMEKKYGLLINEKI